jgi:hypothetical protein
MKNKKSQDATSETIVAEQNASATPVADAIAHSEDGKPIVNGAKQISANTTVAGTKKLGRPVKEGSERQKKLAEMDAKRAANDGYLPQGRPKMENSKRQMQLLAREEAIANGTARGKGRPKMTEEDKAKQKEKREADRKAWLERQALKSEGVQVTETVI